jgi:hypothetical protein
MGIKRSFIILIISSVALLAGCDDGDIITTSFDFDNANLEFCGGPGDYVFYKINTGAAESISLQLSTSDELFLTSDTLNVNIDGNNNRLNYRIFEAEITDNYFCDNIPPTGPAIINEYIGSSGNARIETIAVFDDNDGVDFVDSNDPQDEGFGDLDQDGLPNYYDQDDDGDNVYTLTELGEDPENPLDTDGDGIPNYLDEDDDGDGVLTRYEVSNSEDLDPTDDITDETIGPDYLNPDVSNEVVVDLFRIHNYNLNSSVRVLLNNIVLNSAGEQINQQSLDLGSIPEIVNTNVTLSPDFPQ